MGILPDWMIEREVKIEPFAKEAARPGVVSYGVSSYGYDVRVGRKFKVFTNVRCTVVDPKRFDQGSFVDIEADECLIPPNSFALAETVEYLEIPRDILCICLGKCVSGDTHVVDADTGDYLPIRDFIARKGARTLAMDGLRLGVADVSEHRHSGLEPVYRLTTRSGHTIKATATHPFRTLDGWRELRELAAGDRLAVARSCPVFGSEDWPEHEALLLGFLTAESLCRLGKPSPRDTRDDERLTDVFTEAARAFGIDVSEEERTNYPLVKKRAFQWLASHDVACKAEYKVVPAVVFRARRESVANFLRALFSADGSLHPSKAQRSTPSLTLQYTSSSEALIRGVRHLLLRFGIFSLLRVKVASNGRRAYHLHITDVGNLRRFASEIGFIAGSKKQQTFESYLNIIPKERRPSNIETLPNDAWSRITGVLKEANMSLSQARVRVHAKRSVPLTTVRKAALATKDRGLQELANADVVWDTIESIEPAGVEAVYDLTVPGPDSFYANDIPIHNSTYARCGIIVNVTPLEPEWRGKVTIEISNTTPLPAKIYAGEGIAQILFLRAEAPCRTSYADKRGKYQDQQGVTPPFVLGHEPNPRG